MDKSLPLENFDSNHLKNDEPKQEFYRYIDWKAGMGNFNREEVTRIVETACKNHRYYQRQADIRAKRESQINEMKSKIEKAKKDPQNVESIKAIIKNKMAQIEKERDLSRTWVHFDLDMFYVACEIRDQPQLASQPVAVGGDLYLNTANYVARKFGIYSAMPGFIAKKLCPELIVLPCNLQKYLATSAQFKRILSEFDPNFESKGPDEASLDITEYLNRHNIEGEEEIKILISDLKARINETIGITLSCGIGPNRTLAKIACETNKPDGLFYIQPSLEVITKLVASLSVRKVSGIGIFAQEICFELGIQTCQDILDHLFDLYVALSEKTFDFFLRSALGIGKTQHEGTSNQRKSVSVTRTFDDVSDIETLEVIATELSEMLADNLKKMNKKSRHINLMVKNYNFQLRNKSSFLDKYTDDSNVISRVCSKLLRELNPEEPTRCIALTATELKGEDDLHTLEKYFKKKRPTENSNVNNVLPFELSQTEENELEISTYQQKLEVNNSDQEFQTPKKTIEPEKQESIKEIMPLEDLTPSKANNKSPKKVIIPSKSIVTCPICFMEFDSTVNHSRINNHIDKCLLDCGSDQIKSLEQDLNSTTISEVSSKNNSKEKEKLITMPKLDTIISSSNKNQKNKQSDSDSKKKRKANIFSPESSKESKKTKQSPSVSNSDCKTIDNFFKKKIK